MVLSLITTAAGAYSSMRRLGFWEPPQVAEISAWAANIAEKSRFYGKEAYKRYLGMGMLFGRKLDFDPVSIQPKLLILSTLSDHNGALSSESWSLTNRITAFVPQFLKKWNIQYRLLNLPIAKARGF
jgi:hypothetical protein